MAHQWHQGRVVRQMCTGHRVLHKTQVLHMVVVADQLGMYGYALRHPLKSANANVRNHRGLTCLTLSCELGRDECFKDMLELSATEFWRYSNITCCGYPLGALDSIEPSGQTSERICCK